MDSDECCRLIKQQFTYSIHLIICMYSIRNLSIATSPIRKAKVRGNKVIFPFELGIHCTVTFAKTDVAIDTNLILR